MNSLSKALSPYLLAHSTNPVNWFEYSEEAFEIAKKKDLPVFISIGYQSCHWCHVMAHESFEDESTARYLNDHFISIKIDREERPDLDAIYMDAVLLTTGSGGWPMSVFCFPDKRPFVAGTYYPKIPKGGMPSFTQVLRQIVSIWETERQKLVEVATEITQRLEVGSRLAFNFNSISDHKIIKQSDEFDFKVTGISQSIKNSWDLRNGGFGSAPKFPSPLNVMLTFRAHFYTADNELKDFAVKTLNAMASGGLYDHLLGGFCRYCVDSTWTVPHFEKMLYDQSGMIKIYLIGYLITKNKAYADIVKQTVEWIFSFMTDESGAVYSSIDADSEGGEGDSMIFSLSEIESAISDPQIMQAALNWWTISKHGNFSGKNILRREPGCLPYIQDPMVIKAKSILKDVRLNKPQPQIDDKAVLEFNAMLADALLDAGFILEDGYITQMALKSLSHLLTNYADSDGHYRRATIGSRKFEATATSADVAWLALACLKAYEYTGNQDYVTHAATPINYLIEHYINPHSGEVYMTTNLDETLLFRPQNFYDNVICSNTSSVAMAITKFSKITKSDDYEAIASRIVAPFRKIAFEHPLTFANLIATIDLIDNPFEVKFFGINDELMDLFRRFYLPNRIFLHEKSSDIPKVEICTDGKCFLPTSNPIELEHLILKLTKIKG